MNIKRTYQYRLDPNIQNTATLNHTLELCCWLYNHLLEQFRERDITKQKQFTERELQDALPKIKKEHPFLKEVQSHIFQNVAKRVYKAWQDYKKLKKLDPKKGYPKFRPVHRYNSFTYIQPITKKGCGYKLDNFLLTKKKENRKLRLSLGSQNNHYIQILIKICLSRNLQGDAKTLTIKRKNNRYYACFSCENIPLKPLPKTGKTNSYDLGITHLLTDPNGKKTKNPKFYKQSEKVIKQTQQSLSRKEEKSQNWKDAKLLLAKKWERMVNQYKHYIRQVANEIVRENDIIKVENLNVKGMLIKKLGDGKKSLRRSLMGTKFAIILNILAEAAEIATRQLVKVDPTNTSQTCSSCGELADPKLTLWDRVFRCQSCSLELDRDTNAARNILNRDGFDRSPPPQNGKTLWNVL